MKMQSCDQNESQVSTSSMMFCNYIDADTNNQKNSAIYHTGASFAKSLQLLPKSYSCASQPKLSVSTRCARNDARFFWNFPDKFRGENNYRCVCIYVYVYMYISIYIYMIYIYIYAYTHTLFLYHTVSYYILIHMYHPFVPLIYSHDMLLRLWRPLKKVSSSYHFNNKNTCYCWWFRNPIPNHRKNVKNPVFMMGGTTTLKWLLSPDFWTINSITRTPGGNTAKMFWEFSIWPPADQRRRFWDQKLHRRPFFT